jgi:hypothetical protein
MNKRIIETLPTTGALRGTQFRLDGNLENVSLIWDYADRSLTVNDHNLDYSQLPYELNTQLQKKVFLTYNGISSENNSVIETVVMESSSALDSSGEQNPGHADSNEWGYQPAYFRVNPNYLELTNPADWSTYPYDVSQGFTVVKQFLSAESNFPSPYISDGDTLYTAFFRAPQITHIQLANTTGSTVHTDGWYTSYVIACKHFSVMTQTLSDGDTIPNLALGHIYWDDTTQAYYVNTTGTALVFDSISLTHLPSNDAVNWTTPTFTDWTNLMQSHVDGTFVRRDNIYYIENQHLVTPDLNAAIERELLNICDCCTDRKFGASQIDTWIKLTAKLNGAYYNFHNCFFKDAQCILESARPICAKCSIHKSENLPILGTLNSH